jgi:hypothetical protein
MHSLATDEALDVKDGPLGIERCLELGGISDQALCVGEGHVRWGDAVALIVGDDLHLAILVDSHTTVLQVRNNLSFQYFLPCP